MISVITLFSGRKEQDNGTRLGERTRKKTRQNRQRSLKWKMTSEKIATINDNQIHFQIF